MRWPALLTQEINESLLSPARIWERLPKTIQDRVRRLPVVRTIVRSHERLQEQVVQLQVELRAQRQQREEQQGHGAFPPGHFYSPIVDVSDIRARRDEIFARDAHDIAGIDLREAAQLAVLAELEPFVQTHPFHAEKTAETRYYLENPFFSYADGLSLYAMLRRLRPRRYVEIGSGFSSAVTLDVNERYFDNAMAMTLIEPHPDRLLTLLRDGDRPRFDLLQMPLQQVPLECFTTLEANDVLFVDSTHVSKVGSDVNRIFFEILPRLARGVHVQIHDIFYPFEYPEVWVLDEGRSWNEAYVARAFLQFNGAFEIVLFNNFLAKRHRAELARRTPAFLGNTGASLWLRRV